MTTKGVFADIGWLVLLVLSIPAIIIVIGAPIALLVRAVIEIAQRMYRARGRPSTLIALRHRR